MHPNSEMLGEIRQTFKPKLANIGAGVILGLALLVGGISLAVFLAQRQDPQPLDTGDRIAKYGILGVIGVGAPLAGIALLFWMTRLASHRVKIYENGFSYVYGNSEDVCRWLEVEKISEVFTAEELKVLKVPGAKIKNIDRSFIVRRKDGKEFSFSVNSIDSVPRFAGCLRQASERHSIPWEKINQ